ncbi:MAG: hypothetical protein AAGG38_09765 [Planctomycetota bacterium]
MPRPTLFGYTRSATHTTAEAASRARGQARTAGQRRKQLSEVRDLEDRFERLSLVCMAMWSLVQDKTGLTEAELLERVETIDLMDGREDGKAARVGMVRCAACTRPMSERHMRCIYCGADKPASSAFDRV